MPSGILGTANAAASTNVTVYTVPAGKLAICNISLCNTGNDAATVQIALAKATTPVAGEYIEYDTTLQAKGSMERTGIVLDAGKRVIVRTSVSGLNAVVYGMED